MNLNDIFCLGVDGKIYTVKRYVELKLDENGIPCGYENPKFPAVYLIAKAFLPRELEEHPLRKAFFKFWAAKEHNIVEKQRPQDVTIDEAINMVRDYFRSTGWPDSQINLWIKQYWI